MSINSPGCLVSSPVKNTKKKMFEVVVVQVGLGKCVKALSAWCYMGTML